MDALVLLTWAFIGRFVLGLFILLVLMPPGGRGRGPIQLDVLGVRITPAAHTWTGLGVTANVSDVGNWNGGPLAPGDSFTFDGSLGAASNSSATWDAAAPSSVSNLTIAGAYTANVSLAANLAVTNTLSQTAAQGTMSVGAGNTLSAYNYILQGSTLGGPGAVTDYSLTVSNNATIIGVSKVTPSNLQINGTVTLDQATPLLSGGTRTWNSGQISVLASSQIINAGSFNVLCDQTLRGVIGSFNNPGRFTKSGGVGTTQLTITFNNQPLNGYPVMCFVTVNSGKLEFERPGSQAGEFARSGTAFSTFPPTRKRWQTGRSSAAREPSS